MSEPKIYKPSIYNAPTIYNTGGGGGGGGGGFRQVKYIVKNANINSNININELNIIFEPNGGFEILLYYPQYQNSPSMEPLSDLQGEYMRVRFGDYYGDYAFYTQTGGTSRYILSKSGGHFLKVALKGSNCYYNDGLNSSAVLRTSNIKIGTIFSSNSSGDTGMRIYYLKIFEFDNGEYKVKNHLVPAYDENDEYYIIDLVNNNNLKLNQLSFGAGSPFAFGPPE